jgi:mono/diheme cytochrome c family protein
MSALRPRSVWGRLLLAFVILVVLLLVSSLGSWAWMKAHPVAIVEPPPGVVGLLSASIPDGPAAGQIRRGRYLAIAGDCVSCHTRAGGKWFAGGLGLQTPFGTIYSSNLTSDRDSGLGGWTAEQFYRAVHQGRSVGGKRLYPAMPYPHLTVLSRADTDAIFAFLKTVPPEKYVEPPNRLPFPFNIRLMMIGWNLINFSPHEFKPDPAKPEAWNRGAWLVRGPGHCGACHTQKNLLGAERSSRKLHGGVIENWFAPDLTGNARTGLGRWSADEIAEYLRTGRNARANAVGLMAEVVTYSTSLLTDDDRMAIATYLKSLPASADTSSPAPEKAAMQTGGAIFADACTACHLEEGKGQPRMFPPLKGSAAAQQGDPTGVIRLILAGGRTAPTLDRPSFQTMPSFAWKLDDQQVADVATYVRNSWGNRAPPVSAQQVAKLRSKLDLRAARDAS